MLYNFYLTQFSISAIIKKKIGRRPYTLNGTEHGFQPSLTTRDRELVSVLEVIIEPGDLNPRPLTPQSVTLPTLPRAINLLVGVLSAKF